MLTTVENRVRLAQYLAGPLADLLAVAVIVADADGSALLANRAWTAMTGQSEQQWREQGWFGVLGDKDREGQRAALLAAMHSSATPYDTDWSLDSPALGHRALHISAAASLPNGVLEGFVVTVSDMTEERSRDRYLSHMATHDQLTGLYRRDQFLEFVSHALARQRRVPQQLSTVYFIDVDDLKSTNDRLGHMAGDRLLRTVAAQISAAVRSTDIVARYGGDEFVVLCDDQRNMDMAYQTAERIKAVIGRAETDGEPISVSVGFALCHDPSAGAAALVDLADQAMYFARRRSEAGRRLSRASSMHAHPSNPH